MTKYKPILFNTEMVQAILEGRKTQTRRVVTLPSYHPSLTEKHSDRLLVVNMKLYDGNNDFIGDLKSPFGQVGDILWVRETWFSTRFDCKDLLRIGITNHLRYKADNHYDPRKDCVGRSWKPSIHMPKEACRIFLKIKNIRVERLQDISEEDAKAEGLRSAINDVTSIELFLNYIFYEEKDSKKLFFEKAVQSFHTLWHKINGPASWVKNPWVWVIEFERIEKPDNFC